MPDNDKKDSQEKEDFVSRMGEMISYFMDVRGMPDTDCHSLSAAVQSQINEYLAEKVEEVQQEIRKEFKGETIYIKQGYRGTPHAEAIAAEFTGKNMDEIMERYGVSRCTVYRCVNRGGQ